MKNFILIPILIFTMSISYGQGTWTTSNLSEAKEGMGAAALPGSNTFWFAGGWGDTDETNKVEIYNAETNTWTFSSLSQARSWSAGLAFNNHIFFAGGMFWDNGNTTSRVDIWENEAAQWTTAELSVPRLSVSAVGIGNKAMFAGGAALLQNTSYSVVDIYDLTTKQWSTSTLSEPRAAMGSAVVETPNGPIALFGGGTSAVSGPYTTDLAEIYHANTGTWSTANLSQARAHLSATTAGHKVIFAGGITNDNVLSDRVDIYDAITGEWTTASLSLPRCTDMVDGLTKTVCGKVYIVGGGRIDLITGEFSEASNVIDIYDPTTDSWSVEYLNRPLVTHSVVSDGNRLLVAGGRNTEFSTLYDDVDIYTCPANAVGESKTAAAQYRIYPNPSQGILHIEALGDVAKDAVVVKLHNLQGQLVYTQTISGVNSEISLPKLPDGAYLLSIISETGSHTEWISLQQQSNPSQ